MRKYFSPISSGSSDPSPTNRSPEKDNPSHGEAGIYIGNMFADLDEWTSH